MADNFSVRLRGTAELAAGTRKLAGNIDDAASSDFGRVADEIASQVSGSVPRRTGLLASSAVGEPSAGGASVSMGQGVPYAQYVEYGGRGHPHSAQGNYLYPAAIDAGPRLQAAGEGTARSEIARMTWPSP